MSTDDSSTPYAPRPSAPVASSPTLGIVRWWDDAKGYGFLRLGDDQDAFVHYSAISVAAGRRSLKEGQQVKCDVTETPKGLKAINVVVV